MLALGLAGIAAWSLPEFWRSAPISAPPPLSIAVLPFAAAGDPAERQFADALTQDITTALGRWRWATLASQGATSAYINKAINAQSVGRELNVRYLAAGEVRHAGNKIAVTVHLIDTESGTNAWSDQLAFDMEQRTAEGASAPATRLSKRLRTAIYSAEMRRAAARPLSGNAWDLVLRGDAVLTAGNYDLENTVAARKLYEAALRIDPNFVPALVSIAMTDGNLIGNDLDLDRAQFAKAIDEMDTLTTRAVSIDVNDSSAWHMRSTALSWLGRWDEALAANQKAEVLDPFNPLYVNNHANILLAADRPDDALILAERATTMERGILGEEAFSARTVCQISLLLGRYSEAVRACEKAAAQQNWWVDHAWLTAGYAQNGEMTKAAIAKNELLKQKPRFTIDKLKATDTALNNSAYLQRAETHFYSGLRKAGLADK